MAISCSDLCLRALRFSKRFFAGHALVAKLSVQSVTRARAYICLTMLLTFEHVC